MNCGVGEDSWESLGLQGDPTSPSSRKSVLNIHWKDWCWSWNSNTLATWCEELTSWKRPWCWERLKVGGEGDKRGRDSWKASPTQWTWVWVNSGSWWWTGRPGELQSIGLQRIGHDWVTELNWTELKFQHTDLSPTKFLSHTLITFDFYWDYGTYHRLPGIILICVFIYLLQIFPLPNHTQSYLRTSIWFYFCLSQSLPGKVMMIYVPGFFFQIIHLVVQKMPFISMLRK